MNNSKSKIFLEDQQNQFSYKKSKSNIEITFNRISFIFFIFFIVFLVYSIHLIHLGSRKSDTKIKEELHITILKKAALLEKESKKKKKK